MKDNNVFIVIVILLVILFYISFKYNIILKDKQL